MMNGYSLYESMCKWREPRQWLSIVGLVIGWLLLLDSISSLRQEMPFLCLEMKKQLQTKLYYANLKIFFLAMILTVLASYFYTTIDILINANSVNTWKILYVLPLYNRKFSVYFHITCLNMEKYLLDTPCSKC